MKTTINKRIQESIEIKKKILESVELIDKIENTSALIVNSLRNKGHIYFCGNGGSAADAQHLAAELSGRFYLDRDSLAAEALHCNTSFLTAVSNDYSFDIIYSRLLSGIGKPNDILILLSTSGNSKNIVNAALKAEEIGIKTVGLTGKNGGELANIVDVLINVPDNDTPRIQESHIMIGHIICELVEQTLFGK